LRGEGEAVRGGTPGDLFLRVHVRRDPRFDRDGSTLRSRVEIGFRQAALGTEVDVAVVDGQGIAQTSNVVSSGTTVTFIVSNGETRYVRLTGNAGAYNYTFKRYSNFPPYEGL